MENLHGSTKFKLCVLFTVWGDSEIFQSCLKHTVENLMGGNGDKVMVVYSTISNFGEKSEPPYFFHGAGSLNFEPDLQKNAQINETDKRNFALNWAKQNGFTHFLMCDEDEFYHPEDIERGKKMFEEDTELNGVVVSSQVYFKSPTLTIGLDTTRVPFIHKITPDLKHEFNRKYPFAWEGGRDIKIDPTRSLNINDGVKFVPQIVMHHYSWIRQDYKKKIRNSTAKSNLERSTILQDLMQAKEGYYCNFYGKVLHRVPNYFNIPEYDVMV